MGSNNTKKEEKSNLISNFSELEGEEVEFIHHTPLTNYNIIDEEIVLKLKNGKEYKLVGQPGRHMDSYVQLYFKESNFEKYSNSKLIKIQYIENKGILICFETDEILELKIYSIMCVQVHSAIGDDYSEYFPVGLYLKI